MLGPSMILAGTPAALIVSSRALAAARERPLAIVAFVLALLVTALLVCILLPRT